MWLEVPALLLYHIYRHRTAECPLPNQNTWSGLVVTYFNYSFKLTHLLLERRVPTLLQPVL